MTARHCAIDESFLAIVSLAACKHWTSFHKRSLGMPWSVIDLALLLSVKVFRVLTSLLVGESNLSGEVRSRASSTLPSEPFSGCCILEIHELLTAARSALQIVPDLLQLSRSKADRLQIRFDALALCLQMLNDTFHVFRHRAVS